MLMTLIQKEMMHHILSVRFVMLLVMCLLLVPLTLSINHQNYRKNLLDYQESVKLSKRGRRDPLTHHTDRFPNLSCHELDTDRKD